MPRLKDGTEEHLIAGSNFTYSGARIEKLRTAGGYTLVTITVDESGSVADFADELDKALVTVIEACKDSPWSDNILIRLETFSSRYHNGVNEVHGFKLLSEINPADYPALDPRGMTPLCDACFSSLGAMNSYAKQLLDQDFTSNNGIAFVITDGEENVSVSTMRMVREEAEKSVSGEVLESMISILIGINASECADELSKFQQEAGMTQFIDAGDATPRKLAKLADFVSQSISSQGQSRGTGGPSQDISVTI